MKTTLLKTLHEKSIGTLDLIGQAEAKRNHYIELLTRHQMTTWQNEMKLWPMGLPTSGDWSKEHCEIQVNWYNKVLVRLDKRYLGLLDRITANAIDNYKISLQ